MEKAKKKNSNHIHRSESIREIIGKPPKKIIVIGFIIVSFILISFVVLASIIPYPDTVDAMAVVYPSDQGGLHAAPLKSDIDSIYKSDGSLLHKGDTIMSFSRPDGFDLECSELLDFCTKIRIDSNNIPVNVASVHIDNLKYFKEEFLQFNMEYSKLINDSKENISGINHEMTMSREKSLANLFIDKLKDKVEAERGKYFITAGQDGKLQLLVDPHSTNIPQGEYVAAVIPSDTKIVCKIAIKPDEVSKVKIGQEVRIKLTNYNADVYGEFRGRVTKVFDIDIDGLFVALVDLPGGFTSSSGNKVSFNSKQGGMAKVIVNQRSLLRSFFQKLKPSVSI